MGLPLAHYLKDFSAPQSSNFLSDPLDFAGDPFAVATDAGAVPQLPQPEPVDIEKERAEAYAEGQAEATHALEEAHARALAELEERHAQELQALKARHEAQLSDVISHGLKKISAAIAGMVGEQTAAILAPFLSEALTKKAIKTLTEQLNAAILKGDVGLITIRGPESLFNAVKTHMPDHESLLRHQQSDDVDVVVTVDDQALVTRISAWTASLRKILA
ncbi:hypothetical protein NAC44_03405 [Allorhizobium sp. BGMRC 0089]|uniref:hypothetical protein n=1 Tax=Allorhizobium sonneratiae TaxID=2934936 RepID=UPI002033C6AC|nr:hypothetical protein [Allorhizobium sonneratiae]MCM2291374.1 hypothetical protein [Allorhizobium sonneratiae]